VIGVSQVKHVIGVPVESSEYPIQSIANTFSAFGNSNGTTLAIGLASCFVLVAFAYGMTPLLKAFGVNENAASTIAKIGPLVTVVLASYVVYAAQLNQSRSIGVVGEIPSGMPGITMPEMGWAAIRALLPLALLITLVGYLESFSVAKALASRKREKVAANRELFALGMADIGAAFTGGYPVTGGFSRSIVNYSAGSSTPLGSVYTALFVAFSVSFLTPLFFYIPNAVLAAIIVVAVVPLVDLKAPFKLWAYSPADCLALVATFVAALAGGIESGILVGVVTSVVLMVWKMSRPHVAEVGRVGTTEHFRNVNRYEAQTTPGVFAFRVDESLNFANAPFLDAYIMEQIADRPTIRNVLLISSGINDVDATGLEVLETIRRELELIGVGFYMSDVKGPVTDRLQLAGFDDAFLNEHIFISADEAMRHLT
jgi:SulP family sulfate permease